MTTTSRPANGYGGFSDADWATRFGGQDGLIEDYEGNAFDITLLNDTNEAQFNGAAGRTGPNGNDAAIISVNGYHMLVPAGEKVSLPAPSSGSKTYYIGATYDPALNVAIPGTDPPQASAQGPCRLVAYPDTPDLTGNKRFLLQWVITRTSAALTSAVKVDRRRWIGVSMDYADGNADSAPGNEGSYPRGTIRMASGRFIVRTLNASGTALTWTNPLETLPTAFPLASNIVARKAGTSPEWWRSGVMAGIDGQVARSSGNLTNGSDVLLGTMPAGARPGKTISRPCKCSGSDNFVEVRINTDGVAPDGKVILTDPGGFEATWVDLSPLIYRIGA